MQVTTLTSKSCHILVVLHVQGHQGPLDQGHQARCQLLPLRQDHAHLGPMPLEELLERQLPLQNASQSTLACWRSNLASGGTAVVAARADPGEGVAKSVMSFSNPKETSQCRTRGSWALKVSAHTLVPRTSRNAWLAIVLQMN